MSQEVIYKNEASTKGEWDILVSSGETQREMQRILDTEGRQAYRAFIEGGIARGDIAHVHRRNVVTTLGRGQLTKALTGMIASDAEVQVSHQELGTGTNTPAVGDTGLQTPTGATRKSISSMAASGVEANFTSFWAVGEATGTWREYALFINGTGTSNSGTILNRVAINVTVGAGDALTIDGTITINNG